MITTTRTPMGVVYMILSDRKRLARLMVIQGVSQRELAEAAGWKSHSYLGRLLRGDVNSLDVEPAVRIAMFLGVGTDDLFVARSSSVVAQNSARRSAKVAA